MNLALRLIHIIIAIQAAQFPLPASGMRPFFLARATTRQPFHDKFHDNHLTSLSEEKNEKVFYKYCLSCSIVEILPISRPVCRLPTMHRNVLCFGKLE
jgi:hypothetical protein